MSKTFQDPRVTSLWLPQRCLVCTHVLSKHLEKFTHSPPTFTPSPSFPFPSSSSPQSPAPQTCHENLIKLCVHLTQFHPLKNHSSVRIAGSADLCHLYLAAAHKYFTANEGVKNIIYIVVVTSDEINKSVKSGYVCYRGLTGFHYFTAFFLPLPLHLNLLKGHT